MVIKEVFHNVIKHGVSGDVWDKKKVGKRLLRDYDTFSFVLSNKVIQLVRKS